MSVSQSDQQKGLPASSAPAKAAARKKIRPTYSCLNCHKRKVKCDRVYPCSSCCLRGTPSECEYGTSKRDRQYIEQSVRIDNLVQECENLKRQLAEARALAHLSPIKHEDPFSVSSPKTMDDDEESQNSESQDSSFIKKSPGESDGLDSENDHRISSRKIGQSFRSLSDDKRILTDPALASSLVEVFVERLIDNFSPQPASKYGGTIALREGSGRRVMSPMLCTAFEAASLTFVGRRDRNRDVEARGHDRYVRVLQQLQKALNDPDPEKNKSTDVMVVVLLFTIIEAFKQSSKDSLLKHQLGGLQLLKARTPYGHVKGIDRSLYVDLRLYWVTAALVQRKPTFLASNEWLTVPWPGDAPSKDILHRLLDIAVDIPAYLSQIDDFAAALRSGIAPSTQLVAQQSAIWDRATELQSRLNLWKSMFADTYSPGRAWEEPAETEESKTGFPIFKCRDPQTMQLIVAKSLVYPDLLSATCMTYYWALHLIVSTTDSGLASVLGLQERYQYACNICRSMKYYVENIPGCLVSRIMFVLRTAFDTFADGMVEKEFVTEVFRHIADKFHFGVFANQCASSSVRS